MRRLSSILVAALMSIGESAARYAGSSPAFAAPYGAGRFVSSYGTPRSFPRKDRMYSAAQHKRASRKARNVTKHRRTA